MELKELERQHEQLRHEYNVHIANGLWMLAKPVGREMNSIERKIERAKANYCKDSDCLANCRICIDTLDNLLPNGIHIGHGLEPTLGKCKYEFDKSHMHEDILMYSFKCALADHVWVIPAKIFWNGGREAQWYIGHRSDLIY